MTKTTGVKNRRLLIAKNSIMMLVVLVIIFLAIFAWYFIQHQVTADNITIQAEAPEDIQIAPVAYDNNNHEIIGNWGQSLSLNDEFKFSNDVTSNGLSFIIPSFTSTENNDESKLEALKEGKVVDLDGIATDAINNLQLSPQQVEAGKSADYYSLPFYVRSRTKSLSITPNAYLAMKAEVDGDTITGPSSVRKSVYGNFTSDTLVAAMRTSLVSQPVLSISGPTLDNNPTPNFASGNPETGTFTWVPRPDLFLTIPQNTNEQDWELRPGINKTTNDLTRLGEPLSQGTTFFHNYYSKRYSGNTEVGVQLNKDPSSDNKYTDPLTQEERLSNAYKSDVTSTATVHTGVTVPTLGVRVPLIPENYYDSNDNPISYSAIESYYVYRFRLNLWIEGTDTEARRAMDTGEFSLFLEFRS